MDRLAEMSLSVVANTNRRLFDGMADLRERVRRDGWRRANRWFIETIISLPYCHIEYIVFARSFSDPLPTVEPCLPVDLCRADVVDLDRFEGVVLPSELNYFRQRLAHGRHCFLALNGAKLAAYCWATTRVEFDVDNVEIPLQPGDAYLDDAYTLPPYRRRAIQSALHLYRLAHMQRLGCRRAVLIVAEDNLISQKLVHKLGYRDVARLSFRRIFWKRTYHYHSGMFLQ